jgi:hypothetical protein
MSLLRDKWVWIAALIGALLGLLVSVVYVETATAAAAKPSIVVTDSEIHVNESVPVEGSGFGKFDTVSVAWYLGDASYGLTAFVDNSGAFSISLPASQVPGTYTVKVTPLWKTRAVASTEIEVLP